MPRFTGHDLTCLRGERIVFSALDFALEAGGTLVLVGPNGSGKSSLLRLMAGLGRPLAGTVAWDGEDVAADRESHNTRLHYLGHTDAVKPALTVRENVAFWAALGADDAAASDIRAKADAALGGFGIGRLADLPARYLSAGQRRRVALARLLARSVPLWLLDEPQTALDAEASAALVAAIARHRAAGGMVALATHADLGLAGASVLDLGAAAAPRGD